jgi:SAM-dependent MidA family methyltransferase
MPANAPLASRLHARIAAQGPMPFREFMHAALYDPAEGYYASGKASIGRKGDFFTSVSVGPLFGRLLALQFAEIWQRLGCPAQFDLIEQGAHDGTLASDVLAGIDGLVPREAPRLTIVEPSRAWRERQRQTLSGAPVRWVASLDELPAFCGVHYSNELLDAFPIELWRRTAQGWTERGVASIGGRFAFVDLDRKTAHLDGAPHAPHAPDAPEGAVAEACPAALEWLAAAASRMDRGLLMVIDYGFTGEPGDDVRRIAGTVTAAAGHRQLESPLDSPGDADITAQVDFVSLACAAQGLGLDVLGLTDQHHFLTALARHHFIEGERPDPREMRAFQALAHPTLLGRAFKVFAAGRGIEGGLCGFSLSRRPAFLHRLPAASPPLA